MLFRHEFLHECLAYIPYMECFRNGKVDLVGGSFGGSFGSTSTAARRAWHDANATIIKINDGIEHRVGNIRHNEYGPAKIDTNISIQHNTPAISFGDTWRTMLTGYTPAKYYYIDGKQHRDRNISGEMMPAIIYYNFDGSVCYEAYYTLGRRYHADGFVEHPWDIARINGIRYAHFDA